MTNNNLIEYKPSFISRIKEVFKKIFFRNTTEKINIEEKQENIIENNKRQEFLKQIEDKSNSASQVARKIYPYSWYSNSPRPSKTRAC